MAVKAAQHPVTTLTTIVTNPWFLGAAAIATVAYIAHETSKA